MKNILERIIGQLVDIKDTENENAIVHKVRVESITSEEDISVEIPIVDGQVIAMHSGSVYELTYYIDASVYIQRTQVISRFLSGPVVCVKLQCIGKPKRINRRQYFRMPVLLDAFVKVGDEPFQPMTATNLSAGGLRFISLEAYKADQCLQVRIVLNEDILDIEAEVISCQLMKDSIRRQDVRVKFKRVTNRQESVILQYLFEQQRLIRRKGLA